MNRKRKIEQEVDKTMRSLDGIERAGTAPHFYARLQERLQNRKTRVVPIRRLVAAAAAALLLTFANVFTLLQYGQDYEDQDTGFTRQENLEAFAQEYELELPVIYQPNSEE